MAERAQDSNGVPDLMVLARERDFDGLEAAWMARLDDPSRDLDELFRLADYLVRRKFPDRAELLLWSLVTQVAGESAPAVALDVATRAALAAPEAESLREELVTLYRKAHADVPGLAEALDASGLVSSRDLATALQFVENCLRLRPGAYVLHVRSRRPGRIADFKDGEYVVESEGGAQTLSPLELPNTWEPTDPDDLRALLAFELERLKDLAETGPSRLIEITVRSYGGTADLKQVKQALIPSVIAADDWSSWWNRVKVPLRRSPNLDVSGTGQPRFTLRAEAQRYSDKVRADFKAAKHPFDRIKTVLSYLNELDAGHESDPALAAELVAELIDASTAADASVAIALLATAREVRERFPEVRDPAEDLARRMAERNDVGALLSDLSDDIARAVLAAVKAVAAEAWPRLFADAFPAASLRICDAIARDLRGAGHDDLIASAAETAVTMPEQYAEAFAWVWRHAFDAGGPVSEHVGRLSLTVNLLHVINRLARLPRHAENRDEARQKLTRLRNAVSAGDFRLLRGLIAGVNIDGARRLHQAIASNEALTEHAQLELVHALEDRFPEEFIQTKPLWEDGYLYSTAAGLARRNDEFAKMANEDMPRVATPIGEAADKGDLRENWEYKTALEERDRLVERMSRAREELDRARVINAADIPDGEVCIGTAVLLRETSTGDERRLTFLGPWDSDVVNGVYSYLAPISLRFMGARVGARVQATFDDRESEYEIVAIETVV